jgi:Amt family ammonium transporter
MTPTLVPTAVGLLIQAGFALLTCGLVRKKNAGHLVMLTFTAYVVSVIAYFLIGQRIQSGNRMFLDMALMLVAGYVIVGAVCERISFRAFVVCEIFVAGLLYPGFARLAWNGGWLARHGFMDVGGSSVVHALAGFAALGLAKVLGPRVGKYGRDGQPRPFLAHNIVFVAVGSFIVVIGWMALLVASVPAGSLSAEALAVNASLAAAGGAAAAMAFWMFSYGAPDISMACNGLLAGVVAISASGLLVGPMSALVIGAVAGLIACGGVLFNERTLRVDDPCGSIAVHGYAGWWGTVAAGLFVWNGATPMLTQIAAATACAFYAFGVTYAVFGVINASWRLRVDAEVEAEGLDLSQFGMLAYPDEEGLP